MVVRFTRAVLVSVPLPPGTRRIDAGQFRHPMVETFCLAWFPLGSVANPNDIETVLGNYVPREECRRLSSRLPKGREIRKRSVHNSGELHGI